MVLAKPRAAKLPRTLLILGRVSNLPTVWSNCLAAWLLAGGGRTRDVVLLCLAASLVYLGGVYLNDYFDVDFDRQHQRLRPIPSGQIRARAVGLWALGLLGSGTLALLLCRASAALTLLLLAAIVIYDAVHKATKLSPLLMGFCRFLLYLVAASTGTDHVTGLALWCALALASYVATLSYLARKESTRGPVRWWPLFFLVAPVALALMANGGESREVAIWLSLVLSIWVLPCLRHTLRDSEPNIRFTVAGLLAGIVLVDLLAVAGSSLGIVVIFAALFLLAIVLQRFVPAT